MQRARNRTSSPGSPRVYASFCSRGVRMRDSNTHSHRAARAGGISPKTAASTGTARTLRYALARLDIEHSHEVRVPRDAASIRPVFAQNTRAVAAPTRSPLKGRGVCVGTRRRTRALSLGARRARGGPRVDARLRVSHVSEQALRADTHGRDGDVRVSGEDLEQAEQTFVHRRVRADAKRRRLFRPSASVDDQPVSPSSPRVRRGGPRRVTPSPRARSPQPRAAQSPTRSWSLPRRRTAPRTTPPPPPARGTARRRCAGWARARSRRRGRSVGRPLRSS